MGKYFGTDGFRGEAGIDLTADHAYKVGRFLGWYYNALRERNGNNEPARIVIGKDTRRSSYMFEYSLVAGLTASGADAYLLHVTTTPSVAYIARVDDFDCGIMISASHNPYYDNGIKLIDCYGEKMPEEILLLVEEQVGVCAGSRQASNQTIFEHVRAAAGVFTNDNAGRLVVAVALTQSVIVPAQKTTNLVGMVSGQRDSCLTTEAIGPKILFHYSFSSSKE